MLQLHYPSPSLSPSSPSLLFSWRTMSVLQQVQPFRESMWWRRQGSGAYWWRQCSDHAAEQGSSPTSPTELLTGTKHEWTELRGSINHFESCLYIYMCIYHKCLSPVDHDWYWTICTLIAWYTFHLFSLNDISYILQAIINCHFIKFSSQFPINPTFTTV